MTLKDSTVLITGGTGSFGSRVARHLLDKHPKQIRIFSRDEKKQWEMRRQFPDFRYMLGDVRDPSRLAVAMEGVDFVFHAAALKHVDTAERSPIAASKANIVGTMNVVEACVESEVKVAIAISTDKACMADSCYGYTKALTERIFLEADCQRTAFAVCRFGNVAHSHGSVIPFWLSLKAEGKTLPLTSKKMNRLMFSRFEAAALVSKAVDKARNGGGFVLSTPMKSVNMETLAGLISADIEEIGLRPGEKFDEILISAEESRFTRMEEGLFVIDYQDPLVEEEICVSEYSSLTAEFMTESELRQLIDDADSTLSASLLRSKLY